MSPIFPEINFKTPCLLFHHSQKFSLPWEKLFSFLAFNLIQWLILIRHKVTPGQKSYTSNLWHVCVHMCSWLYWSDSLLSLRVTLSSAGIIISIPQSRKLTQELSGSPLMGAWLATPWMTKLPDLSWPQFLAPPPPGVITPTSQHLWESWDTHLASWAKGSASHICHEAPHTQACAATNGRLLHRMAGCCTVELLTSSAQRPHTRKPRHSCAIINTVREKRHTHTHVSSFTQVFKWAPNLEHLGMKPWAFDAEGLRSRVLSCAQGGVLLQGPVNPEEPSQVTGISA